MDGRWFPKDVAEKSRIEMFITLYTKKFVKQNLHLFNKLLEMYQTEEETEDEKDDNASKLKKKTNHSLRN